MVARKSKASPKPKAAPSKVKSKPAPKVTRAKRAPSVGRATSKTRGTSSTAASRKKTVSKEKGVVSAKKAPLAKGKAAPVKKATAPKTKAAAKPTAPPDKVKPSRAKSSVIASAPPPAPEPGGRRQGGVSLKFLVSVAQAIKDAVAPLARSIKGREIVDESPSGDVTFQIDRVAERTLLAHLKSAGLPLSYYSEHEGYSTFSSKPPKSLLIVDPIDGTRAAKSGFEGCVIAVASTHVIERPTMADLDCACVMELLGDRIFLAERGKGARYYVDGHLKRPKLSTNTDIESMSWSMTIPARPAELIFPTAARIIDLSSLKGGFFSCNSTSYSLTRLVTNQLDACVDVANRYYRDIPDRVKDYFVNAGRGKIIGAAPYDIAAGLLVAEEAGCIVTDAYGKRFDELLLLDSSSTNHQSVIAASNKILHEKLLSFFDTRIKQYEALLSRHKTGK